MGTLLWPYCLTAPRLRRPGAGTFFRPTGTLPATLCAGKYAGLYTQYTSTNVSYVKTTNAETLSETPDRDESQEYVAT